jgi:hypothetical protein
MQFESVVTNSTLTFSDIAFLEIDRDIASLLNLAELGGTDWQRMLDNFTKVPGNFTIENLKGDIDNLYNMGVGLATSGMENLGDALLQSSAFHDLLGGKVNEIGNLYEHYGTLFEQAEHDIGSLLIDMVGGQDSVAALFNFSNYDLTSWMTDYMDNAVGNYYTQRWYIARRDQGSISLCDYYPPTDDNSILNGGAWTRFNTSDPGFYPNASQREQALANSERYAGWSRSRVQQLNNSNDGYTYTINTRQQAYIISKGNKQTKKAYAYEIHVTQSWNRTEVVYEDVFDSYSMDLNTFKAQLNARLSEFNDNEEGYVYYIASDARNYYQATDAAKLQGCESVTISVTCSDGATLGQGSTQYKCRKCGGSLDAHSKECVMQTSVTENELDLSELDALIREADNQVAVLQSQISALEKENADLLKKIAEASVEDAAAYRQQYNSNRTRIEELENKIAIGFPAEIRKCKEQIENATVDAATVKEHSVVDADGKDVFCIQLEKKVYYEKEPAGKALLGLLGLALNSEKPVPIGYFKGMELQIQHLPFGNEYYARLAGSGTYSTQLGADVLGNLTRLSNLANGIEPSIEKTRNMQIQLEQQLASAEEEVKRPFPQATELTEKSKRLAVLEGLLNMNDKDIVTDTEPEQQCQTDNRQRGQEER